MDDEWMDVWMDRWMNGCMGDGWTDTWMIEIFGATSPLLEKTFGTLGLWLLTALTCSLLSASHTQWER